MRTVVSGIVLVLVVIVALPFAQRGRKVSGFVVVEATRQPIENARVWYDESGEPTQETVTDAKGYFEFRSGYLGVVTVIAQGFGTARRRWPPTEGRAQLDVAVTRPATLRGTVADMVSGRPVDAAVTVMVRHPGNVVSETVKTEGGAFQIDDVPFGPAVVLAVADGFAPYLGTVTVEGGATSDLRARLLLEAIAEGRVLDSNGSPVQGAFVSVAYSGPVGGGGRLEGFVGGRPWTGSDGEFALIGLVPDTLIALQAEFDGRLSEVETIRVGPGMAQENIVLRLP